MPAENFDSYASRLVACDQQVQERNEVSGPKIWESIQRNRGDRIICEAACWLSGPLARRIQMANLLLQTGLLGEGSPYDAKMQFLIMRSIRRINALNIAWMSRNDDKAEVYAQNLRKIVYEEFLVLNEGYPGLITYQNDNDFLGLLAGITGDILTQWNGYVEKRDMYLKQEKLWFGFRNPLVEMLMMIADGDGREALQKFLNTVYTPIVAAVTRWGRGSYRIEAPVRATVWDEETGREVEVEVEAGIRAFRREGPLGNQTVILSAHSRPLGDGEGELLANEGLRSVIEVVITEHGPFTNWRGFESSVKAKMEEQGMSMPEEPDVVQAAEGIMFGKAFLYALFGGVKAIYFDMSRFAYERPHDPKTWVEFLKGIFGKVAFFLNIEDTRFPAVLDIERAVTEEFPELPTLLDDRAGTVVITRVGVEAAMVRTGRRTRKEIEIGGRTLEGMTFVVAGTGTAGGELIEKLAGKGASVYCLDSKGGLNRARLEREAESSDALRRAKAQEKLALLETTGVQETEEGETFRSIIERLEHAGTAVDGVIDLSGDPNLGQIDPTTGQRYDTSIEEFLAENMARNPIVFSLTNPKPPIDVVEFLRHVKRLDKADSIGEDEASKGVRVAVATGRGGTIKSSDLAQWFGQNFVDMINNNFVFPVLARICLDACCPLTQDIRDAVVSSYALSAIDIGRVTPDMWNAEHFAQAVKAGIFAARNSGVARMIMDHTGKVRWLRTVEQSMQIVRDSMNFFIQMSANSDIRRQIEDVVGCKLFV